MRKRGAHLSDREKVGDSGSRRVSYIRGREAGSEQHIEEPSSSSTFLIAHSLRGERKRTGEGEARGEAERERRREASSEGERVVQEKCEGRRCSALSERKAGRRAQCNL